VLQNASTLIGQLGSVHICELTKIIQIYEASCLLSLSKSLHLHFQNPNVNISNCLSADSDQSLILDKPMKNKKMLVLLVPLSVSRSCKRSDTLFQKSLLSFSTWREYFYSQTTHFSSQPKK